LRQELDVLPRAYGRTTIVLMAVNPYLVHAYWEVVPKDLEEAKGLRDPLAQPALRFYDVTGISFDGSNAHGCFDVDVQLAAENWYVHLWSPAKSYVVDLGLRTADGGFLALARSNIAHTPPASPSMKVDVRHLPVHVASKVQKMSAAESPAKEPDAAMPPGKAPREKEGRMAGRSGPVAAIDMARTVWKKLAGLYSRLLRAEPGYEPKLANESSGARPSPRAPRHGESPAFATGASTQTAATRFVDLTQMNENSFTSGMSSR
jgi:hypothetical protein